MGTVLYRSLMLPVLLSVILLTPGPAHAARLKACVKSDGSVVVKRRCRSARGETQLDLATVSLLAEGPQGEKGDKGDTGPAGATGHQFFQKEATYFLNPGDQKGISLSCPLDTSVVNHSCFAGGFIIDLVDSNSGLATNGRSVSCNYKNNSGAIPQNVTMTLDLVCGPLGEP